MKERKEIERRWELEVKKMIIPTVGKIMRKENLSLEEAAKRCVTICGNEHKNFDCHRKLNGYNICDDCPKYQPEKKELDYLEWGMRVQAIPTQHKLVSKRR